MSSQATIALAVLPAVVAVFGTLGAARMADRRAKDEREAAARSERRARAGEVIGVARLLLVDMTPELVLLNLNNSSDAAMPKRIEDWRDLRTRLSMFAESDHDADVRETTRTLIGEIGGTFNRLMGALADQRTGHQFGVEMLEAANNHWSEAFRLLDKLGDLTR